MIDFDIKEDYIIAVFKPKNGQDLRRIDKPCGRESCIGGSVSGSGRARGPSVH